MKKLLIGVLLAASVFAGYTLGMGGTSSVKNSQTGSTASSSAVPSIIKDIFHSATASMSSREETPSASAAGDNGNVKKDTTKNDESLTDKIHDVRDFRNELESRVDRKKFVPYKDINPLMIKALVATEDRRFYDHGALDIMGVARAAVTNYMAGTTVEGGSTISQQTVKNIFLSNERTMSRKVEELLLAMQLEKYYSKEQILELYLNTIYFGHGAYGIGEASETYFHKKPADLNLAQCAMLAGLPQAPTAYDPIDHPKDGMNRMGVVLTLMTTEGICTAQDAISAPAHLWDK